MTTLLPVKKRSSRDVVPSSPKPILDRQALENALDDADIVLKPGQLDSFYQQLHRQHYPPLVDFVETYYRNERFKHHQEPIELDNPNTPPSTTTTAPLLLKNPVSSRRTKQNLRELPKKLLDFLQKDVDFSTLTSTVHCIKTSADKSTTKLAIKLQDGHLIESVIMRYNVTTQGSSRATLCVSSQVGCAMGCTFCATGTMGIRGNLSSGEILEQLVHASRILAKDANVDDTTNNKTKKPKTAKNQKQQRQKQQQQQLNLVRNVVFMGMGEPLNNYNNVIQACKSLIDCKTWNLAHGHVTVSTVGVTSKIRQLTRDLPQVNLALSLHAPNQTMRSAIVPAAKAYPIEGLIEALDAHMMAAPKNNKNSRKKGNKDGQQGFFCKEDRIQASKKKRAMIEYVMLEGDTSTFECAHQLGKLCENRHLVVNLIPYNQTDVKDKLKCPSEAHMKEFQRIVASYGSFCSIRRTMGADIASACGQLVVNNNQEEEETKYNVDIEDGPFGSTTSAHTTKRGIGTTLRRRSSQSTSKSDSQDDDNDDMVDNITATDDDACSMEQWVRPLTIATSIAASCFLVSTILFLSQKQRR